MHPQYYTPFLSFSIGKTEFIYKQMYCHDIMEGSFGNAVVSDLTNYPATVVPSKEGTASIHKRKEYESMKREFLGLKGNNNSQQENSIHFEVFMYSEHCPLHKPNILSSLSCEIAETKILFQWEHFMRVIDYFFDKFLWALTDSNPYESREDRLKKGHLIDLGSMSLSEIRAFDL